MAKTLPRVLTGLALVLVATAVAACSSSGSKDKTQTAAPAGAETSAATPEGTADATTGKLDDLTSKFVSSTFHATYNATSSDPSGLNGEVQLFKDGDQRLRFDATVMQDGQPLQVSFIQTPEQSVLCLNDAGALGALLGLQPGQGTCLKGDSSDSPLGDLSSLFTDLENTNVTPTQTSSRTIAGKDTSCFQSTDSTTGTATTACFTDDGILMYTKEEGDAPFEIEATAVTGSVGDADFALPYEVHDLPSAP